MPLANPMNAAVRLQLLSVEDYLAGEELAQQKHEYVDGLIYAMVGGSYAHNLVASNVLGHLHAQLRGKPCRALNSDSKIRTQLGLRTKFYYPDASVVCTPNRLEGVYQDKPTVVVEVMSSSTQRVDEGEKLDAYLSIASLSVYILLRQDSAAVTVYRRDGQSFLREVYTDDAVIPLPEIDAELSLVEVYAEVKFVREISQED